MMEGNNLFPVFLKLNEIRVLIVGGGNVAVEKLNALLKNDPNAQVSVVAPFISESILKITSTHSEVNTIGRPFRFTDLDQVEVAILATDDPDLHQLIHKEAHRYGVLLNVADTPDLCDFYLGSTVKRGDLKIGISTNGKSPTLAKRVREVLEAIFPDETNELLRNLKTIRDQLKGTFTQKVKQLNHITKSLVEQGNGIS